MHKVLVNRLGGLSLPKKSVVRLTDRPDMTLHFNRGRKTTTQQQNILRYFIFSCLFKGGIKKNLAQFTKLQDGNAQMRVGILQM